MHLRQPSLETVINATVRIVLIYLVGVLVLPWPAAGFGLFGVASVATVWMAFRILKDPRGTDKRFEDQFYQDRDDIRRIKTR
jgi:hypothetical protein